MLGGDGGAGTAMPLAGKKIKIKKGWLAYDFTYVLFWAGQAMNVCVSDRTAERRIGRRLVSDGGCSSGWGWKTMCRQWTGFENGERHEGVSSSRNSKARRGHVAMVKGSRCCGQMPYGLSAPLRLDVAYASIATVYLKLHKDTGELALPASRSHFATG